MFIKVDNTVVDVDEINFVRTLFQKKFVAPNGESKIFVLSDDVPVDITYFDEYTKECKTIKDQGSILRKEVVVSFKNNPDKLYFRGSYADEFLLKFESVVKISG